VPIAVLGGVRAPGYYYVPADMVLRDVIMTAGGPIGQGDLTKAHIRRDGQVLWDERAVRLALSEGLSLDGLHLRAGDEIQVPERSRFQFSTVVAAVSAGLAAVVAVVQLSR
jgi:protein involved in polysaccharide export with SLBB domain